MAGTGFSWPAVLANLMLALLLAAGFSSSLPLVGGAGRGWAAPGQDPQRQTVPTPPPPPKTEAPSQPRPVPTAWPTSTLTPSPLPTVTSLPATPAPTASPTAQLTLLPTPVGQTPTGGQKCQPLEKTISPRRGDELDLLIPCRIRVQVPAGAVIEDTLLRLSPRLLTDAPPSEAGLQMRSVAFTLDALSFGGQPRPGFIFARPYTATVRYNQADVEIGGGRADDLTIAHYDAAAREWVPLDSQVDPREKLVSAKFDQPGWLALMFVLSEVEGTDLSEGAPTQQTASTPGPVLGGAAVTATAPMPVSPSQLGETGHPTCFLGIAGALFLVALAVRLYAANWG
jgi:hypothetical protein